MKSEDKAKITASLHDLATQMFKHINIYIWFIIMLSNREVVWVNMFEIRIFKTKKKIM